LGHYRSLGVTELWKSTSAQLQDGGRRQNFYLFFDRCNLTTDCAILLIWSCDSRYSTNDQDRRSQRKVTY